MYLLKYGLPGVLDFSLSHSTQDYSARQINHTDMAAPTQTPKDHVFDPGDMASLQYATDIDRRHCKRTVPLRVLCLGQSRTGTVSIRQALINLGYKDCYHYASALQENPRDTELWIEALEAKFKGIGKAYGKEEWDALLGHCQAVTDTPCVLFYKELLAAYPDAKVILSERDSADQWFRSQLSTTIPWASELAPESWLGKFKALFSPADPRTTKMMKLILQDTPVFAALLKDYKHDTETAKKLYDDYNAEIKRLVPREDLLVFNVKEGWKPLCDFLGEKAPEEAFPRRNNNAAFAKNKAAFMGVLQATSQRNMLVVGAGLAAGLAVLAFVAS